MDALWGRAFLLMSSSRGRLSPIDLQTFLFTSGLHENQQVLAFRGKDASREGASFSRHFIFVLLPTACSSSIPRPGLMQ